MKILLTFNDSFAPHGAAVISELLNYASKPFGVVVLYSDMHQKTIEKFNGYYKSKLQSLEFYKVDVDGDLARKLRKIKSQPHLIGKIEPYLRLFAPLYIKDDEVIYLDCDILVKGDIFEMLKEVDYDCVVSGVQEHDPKHKKHNYCKLDEYTTPSSFENYFYRDAFFYRLKKYYGMDDDAAYMCDGIMHMNLKLWRKENLMDKIQKNLDKFQFFYSADQDVLNSVINGRFGVLSPKWNTIVNGAGIMAHYTSEQYKEAKEHPIIIHMPGSNKPWIKGRKGQNVEDYWSARRDTPWPMRIEIPSQSVKANLLMRGYHFILTRIINIANALNSIGIKKKENDFAYPYSFD